MSGFGTDPAELLTAQARVDDAATRGWAELARLEADATDVFGSYWRGRAASRVQGDLDEWLAGVRQVLTGLQELATALGSAAADYAAAETATYGGCHRLAS